MQARPWLPLAFGPLPLAFATPVAAMALAAGIAVAETPVLSDPAGPGLAVSGQVFVAGGAPLVGARVELRPILDDYRAGAALFEGRLAPEPAAVAATDDLGWYRLEAPDTGFWLVRVEAEGHLPMEYPIAPLLGARVLNPVTPRLPDRRIELSLDHAGAPLAGALLRFVWPRTTGVPWDLSEIVRTGWRPAPRLVPTDASGKGTVGVRDGETLDWAAVAPGMQPRWGRLRDPAG
ncbi:MAG: carboxypeptidase-like regulatory domain-containing protein, partial [Acidobacteriota bacterium]